MEKEKASINILVTGPIGSGKTTTTAHLVYKMGGIEERVMKRFEKFASERNKELSQVIDVVNTEIIRGTKAALWKFDTTKYDCTVLDDPWQNDFFMDMIRGRFQVDCTVLIIDSATGAFEAGIPIEGHPAEFVLRAYLILGVKQMICCCNKMDATDPKYSKARYDEIVDEVSSYLRKVGYDPDKIPFLPISGSEGDNLIDRSLSLDWYKGPTLLEAIDMLNEPTKPSDHHIRHLCMSTARAETALLSHILNDILDELDELPDDGEFLEEESSALIQEETPTFADLALNDGTCQKLELICVDFLRLSRRLHQTIHNEFVYQVVLRLGWAINKMRNINGFRLDRAYDMAEQLDAVTQEPLALDCTIMLIGKKGVGKSSTINSFFGDIENPGRPLQLHTQAVQIIPAKVAGVRITFIDTPGLSPSSSDQHRNEEILRSVKSFMSLNRPSIVLYADRLDMPSRDHDVPLLQTITDILGASIWSNTSIVLTHADNIQYDDHRESELSTARRFLELQKAIHDVTGCPWLSNPCALVWNHSVYRRNEGGRMVLTDGQVRFMLLAFTSAILAEARRVLKLEDAPPLPGPHSTGIPSLHDLLWIGRWNVLDGRYIWPKIPLERQITNINRTAFCGSEHWHSSWRREL